MSDDPDGEIEEIDEEDPREGDINHLSSSEEYLLQHALDSGGADDAGVTSRLHAEIARLRREVIESSSRHRRELKDIEANHLLEIITLRRLHAAEIASLQGMKSSSVSELGDGNSISTSLKAKRKRRTKAELAMDPNFVSKGRNDVGVRHRRSKDELALDMAFISKGKRRPRRVNRRSDDDSDDNDEGNVSTESAEEEAEKIESVDEEEDFAGDVKKSLIAPPTTATVISSQTIAKMRSEEGSGEGLVRKKRRRRTKQELALDPTFVSTSKKRLSVSSVPMTPSNSIVSSTGEAARQVEDGEGMGDSVSAILEQLEEVYSMIT